jgi:hypothetical protein
MFKLKENILEVNSLEYYKLTPYSIKYIFIKIIRKKGKSLILIKLTINRKEKVY